MQFMTAPDDMLFFFGRALLLVAAFLVFAVTFRRWRQAAERDMQRVLEELAQARRDTGALATATEALVHRVLGLEEKLEACGTLGATTVREPRGYDLALRLARSGTAPEEIAETSGVTRREAELLVRLHAPRKTA
ncbi:MAG: hypothetical protein RL026_742 [Pseudomonadota bacterium]|jgi:hypothetical protein